MAAGGGAQGHRIHCISLLGNKISTSTKRNLNQAVAYSGIFVGGFFLSISSQARRNGQLSLCAASPTEVLASQKMQ
jgi:hypothetical protein